MEQIHSPNEAPVQRTPWFLLASLGLAVFASVSAELLPPAVVLGMTATLDVSPSAIGSLVTVWAATIVVGTFPMVRLTARWPRKRLLVAALLLFAASNLVVAFVPVLAVVIAARIISALMAAVTWAVIFGYVPALVSPDKLGRAMSVVLGGGTLASVLGAPLGAFLAAVGAWQLAFVGAALVLSLAGAVAARWLPALPGAVTQLGPRSRVDRSIRGVLALLGAGALLLTGYMTLCAYIVPVLVGRVGLSEEAASGVLFAAGTAGALGLLASGIAGDRWPRAALLGIVAAVPGGSALVMLAVMSAAPPAFAIAGATLIGFGIGGVPPLFQARVTRTASSAMRALAASAFVVVLNVGIALGSGVGAMLFAHLGAVAVAVTAVILTAVSLVIFAVTTATVRDSEVAWTADATV